ncbi:MAG: hypothetical protein V3U37_04875 [Nitrospinaceae bacterium]
MSEVHNQLQIHKCIVSFSHNRYSSRKKATRTALAKARREIASGKRGISHLIVRAEDDRIDQLKFLFLIHGIPIACYAMENLLRSSLEEIVVVGSPEVQRVLEHFLDRVGTHGKKVTFVHEHLDNLSLLNTLALGRSKLSLASDEMILFQPGDLPFMYDIEKVLQDEELEHYNLILWLNSRQKMFPRFMEDPESEFILRNYHYRAIKEEEDELHEIKEPNLYPINLSAVESDIIEYMHSSRKDGNILKAGAKKVLSVPGRLLRLIPVLAYHVINFRSDLKRFRKQDTYQFGMHQGNFHRGVSILLNTEFTSKFHNDPAFVSDVDALEDWEDFEALTHYAGSLHKDEGLSLVHPGGEDLLRFKEEGMPQLKKELPIYADFPSYINNLYRELQMGYVPFDENGNYVSRKNHGRVEKAFQWYSSRCNALKKSTVGEKLQNTVSPAKI